jgi:hypothetical protein
VLEHLLPLCLLLLTDPLKDHLLWLLELCLHLLLYLEGGLRLSSHSLNQCGKLVWLGHLSSCDRGNR